MTNANIDFDSLKVEVLDSPHEVTYKFSGDVDENFHQEQVPRIARPSIVFHLAEVQNINSCGIREWIYLVRDMSKMGALKFRECSVAMIDQINMVPDSLGSGVIESFYAPYYCSCDGSEVVRLINAADAISMLANKVAPEFTCEKCKNKLEFDALEESYFLFVGSGVSEAS